MAKKEDLPVGKQRNGILHRNQNTYLLRVMVNGERHYQYAGADYEGAKLVALDYKRRVVQEKLTGRNTEIAKLLNKPSNLSVGKLVDHYIQAHEPITKPLTVRFYKNTAVYLKSIFDRPINALTVTELTAFIKQLQQKNLSAKTINHVLALARSACNFGVSDKLIERNPFNEIKKLRVTKHEPEPFTNAELEKIWANLDKHIQPYFLLQVSTGIRTGELLALRWSDIDFKNNQITITRSRWKNQEGTTKTAGSERIVDIPDWLKKVLKDLKCSRRAGDSAHIVVNKSGDPYRIYLHRYWQKALKDAKVPYRPNYVLRSTFASMALQNGADIAYISKSLGHGSIRITWEKYMRYIKDNVDQRNKTIINDLIHLPSSPT